jgi:hypothetical protein
MKFFTDWNMYSQMAGFREMVDVCGLRDLGYRGIPWTFEKKVAGGSYYRTRLDRALASPDSSARFPAAEVQHLGSFATSDHISILLRHRPVGDRMGGRKLKPFRYEVAWETHKDFSDIVRQNWEAEGVSSSVEELQHKLTTLSMDLSRWGERSFRNIQWQIRELQRELGVLRSTADRAGPSTHEEDVAARLVVLLEQEKIIWRQRS